LGKTEDQRLWTRYRMTRDDYNAMWERQGRACQLCRATVGRFVVDHDHSCCPGMRSCGKCVRGILCQSCNVRIGIIEELPLVAIMAYLQTRNGRW
jgi:hypothetical protein